MQQWEADMDGKKIIERGKLVSSGRDLPWHQPMRRCRPAMILGRRAGRDMPARRRPLLSGICLQGKIRAGILVPMRRCRNSA